MKNQAQWLDRKFLITEKTIKLLENLSLNYKIKKTNDKTSGMVKIDGHELQSIPFEYVVSPVTGVSPLTEYYTMVTYLNKTGPLLLGGTLLGPTNMRLDGVELESDKISNNGAILEAKIKLTFTEEEKTGKQYAAKAAKYISPIKRDCYTEPPQAVEDLILKVLYNGIDITDAISINKCIHDMYACSRADTLLLTFNDDNKVWDGWQAKAENIISVTYGVAKSGAMFIESLLPRNGEYELRASSIPPTAKKDNNKSWENVKFSQFAKEIADRNGLGFEMYGVEDKLYSYVAQENEPDFTFLQKRCNLESLAFVVFDKKLIIYSEEYLEQQKPLETVEIDSDKEFEYNDNSLKGLGSLTVKNGSLSGVYKSTNGLSRVGERIIKTFMSGQAEADRFAKGLWRQECKELACGWFKDALMREYSAGSIMELKTLGANSWNGNVFISHIRQNYLNSTSKIFFRKADIN